MKRSTENGIPGRPVKRAAGSDRAEMGMSEPATAAADPSSSVSAGGGGGGGAAAASGPNVNDSIRYLMAVKDVLKDDKDTYKEFLDVMKKFRATWKIDIPGMIVGVKELFIRVKELFRGHPALIPGFNAFLAEDDEIILPEIEEQHTSEGLVRLHWAIDFITKVKTLFQNDQQVMREFMEILITQEMYHKGVHLLPQDADLLEYFISFFPEFCAVALATVRAGSATNLWFAAAFVVSWLRVAVESWEVADDLDQDRQVCD